MQIHQLKPKHTNKGKRRVGRGGKKGTYSGKGIKGQKSRSGRKMEPFIREVLKRYPKLKGYRSFVLPGGIQEVQLADLEKHAIEGEMINPANLVKWNLIKKSKKALKVKILGNEKLSKKLVIENCKVSKSAKEAIEKAGGIIK